jgi:hypothetical protein
MYNVFYFSCIYMYFVDIVDCLIPEHISFYEIFVLFSTLPYRQNHIDPYLRHFIKYVPAPTMYNFVIFRETVSHWTTYGMTQRENENPGNVEIQDRGKIACKIRTKM